jgi:hypothetical protein
MKFSIKTATLALMLLAPGAAQAKIYWQPADLLRDFFPQASRFETVTVRLAGHDAEVKARLGYLPPKRELKYFKAVQGDAVLGWAYFDDQVGEHEPITFGVKLGPDGHVLRQEILAYREPRGDEVRAESFRRQFVGKGPGDRIRVGDDIAGVAGASYSSRAMAVGVKRAVQLFDLFVRPETKS